MNTRRMKMRGYQITTALFICIFLYLMFCDVYSQSPQEDRSLPKQTEALPDLNEGFGGMVFKTLFSLGILTGLIIFGTWGLKRFVFRRGGRDATAVRVLGSTILGPKKRIFLVEVERRRLMLGVTDAAISFITELEPAQESNQSDAGLHQEFSKHPFREVLNSLTKKRGNDAQET